MLVSYYEARKKGISPEFMVVVLGANEKLWADERADAERLIDIDFEPGGVSAAFESKTCAPTPLEPANATKVEPEPGVTVTASAEKYAKNCHTLFATVVRVAV